MQFLASQIEYLSAFQPLFVRAVLASLTALVLTLGAGSSFIALLTRRQLYHADRDLDFKRPDGSKKSVTPTMGGILMLVALWVSVLLWGKLDNDYLWIALLVTLAFGAIGLFDDRAKVLGQGARGLSVRHKYFWQSAIAVSVALYLYTFAETAAQTQLVFPFFKGEGISLGPLYIVLCYFVLVGSSNAVNLTDGLDGLAVLPVALVALALGIIAYFAGDIALAGLFRIPYIAGAGELAVFCGALAGAGLGFLWFNTLPAQVFMGDVGSLALGAALGIVAVIIRHELLFLIMAGLFVAETISVILQVGIYKFNGRRLFLMAPLHHHFELAGWSESRIVVRFWLCSLVLVLFGLTALVLP